MVSDSQSSSSIENHVPVNKKNRKRETEVLRRLSQRITQQKQLIVRNLDNQLPKAHLDSQIAVSITLNFIPRLFISYLLNKLCGQTV